MHPAALLPPAPQPWRLATGATVRPDGAQGAADRVRFRVWAPRVRRVEAVFPRREGRREPLREVDEGLYEVVLPDVPPGSDYTYRLDGGASVPDPVSRWQPQGVHGPSRVVDPAAHPWTDRAWAGLPLEQAVFYELHVGTFTPAGTFDAAIGRLDDLRALGVTAVELMPVAAFPGSRNWGYDGVHLYAPQESYGGPAALARLVDACHARGMALVLDVVYNHLGPEGNYLQRFGPYFSGRHHTPWGDALNFDDRDCEPVRRHFIDNALYWLTEYHVDGLRLDAIHAIFDFGVRHVLAELAEVFHEQARRLGRTAWLIAESDLNDTRVIDPPERGGWGLDAQWNDDFHHAQHALLTGARHGYFADFGRVADLCKALRQGFVLDGGYSRYRRRRHGMASLGRPGRQFVVAVQNHDQVANASAGRRLGALVPPAAERLAAAVLLCAPNPPLLFMGQEWGAATPFHYFTSHSDPAVARAVSEGRRRELLSLQNGAHFADPQAESTFVASRLDWAEAQRAPHAGLRRWYRDLLALRREQACLRELEPARTRADGDDAARWLVLQREGADGSVAVLACNYRGEAQPVPLPVRGAGWRRALWSGDPAYGGAAQAPGTPAPPLALQASLPGDASAPQGAALAVPLGPWEAVLYLHRCAS